MKKYVKVCETMKKYVEVCESMKKYEEVWKSPIPPISGTGEGTEVEEGTVFD